MESQMADTASRIDRIKDNIKKVLVGKEEVTDLVLAAFFAGGHVLLEDMPGTGKTVLARTLSRSLDMSFGRIQFTPDLLPSDVTGLSYYNQAQGEFVFREGPVFTNILLADEINRATPRTQSALLECMGEGQVTVDGKTRLLSEPFFVIATENPVETYGCFPLPEAQLDRFLLKLSMGTLKKADEKRMLDRFFPNEKSVSAESISVSEDKSVPEDSPSPGGAGPEEAVRPVLSRAETLALRDDCRRVYVHDDIRNYLVELVQRTRRTGDGNENREGVSPRGTLAFFRACQGYALVQGRDFVTPEDVKIMAVPALAHRYICEEEDDRAKRERINHLLLSVPVPTEDWRRR